MFAGIARRYDIANRVMSFGRDRAWRRAAAALAAPQSCALALDLATGTGELGFHLLSRCDRVVGVDLTPSMIAEADAKVRSRGVEGRFALAVADALRLPFPDATFDCSTNAFALRNFADLRAALAEMRRVVKPGGRVVSLELTKPGPWPLRWAHRAYMEGVVPLVGGITSGGHIREYRYLPSSVHRMMNADELANAMREAGFSSVGYRLFNLRSIAIHVAQV
jgi:demethylmenaquinone methyltransferase/2-methoxy-6-polyprenyl-1,4-benzoquinol methylase